MRWIVYSCVSALACAPLLAQQEIPVRVAPTPLYAGQTAALIPAGSTKFYRALLAFRWDGRDSFALVQSLSPEALVFTVPAQAEPGEHAVEAVFDDNLVARARLTVIAHTPSYDSTDGTDPNPTTQHGPPVEPGQSPRPLPPGSSGSHPPGGYHGVPPGVPCSRLHAIDGTFTPDILPGRREWDGIPPLTGRFSYLYLDYCPDSNRLYLLNDWCLGTGSYDASTCYNLFEFYTGGGREYWQVRIYHDTTKGIKVFRNGVDVSQDTNYVCGGAFGYGPTALCPQPHTIYEFCLTVEPGGFYLPTVGDPVQPVTTSTVHCDENGYGLIREPLQYVLNLSSNGVQWYQYPRYIPLAEVAGLVKEPNTLGGTLQGSEARYWWSGERSSWGTPPTGSPSPVATSQCRADKRILDGAFSPGEWDGAQPARGRYSDLYAQYCNGILHVLNDWVLGTDEPDPNECYNLFEVFTAGGAEHWGIFVYHSKQRGIRVFRNGVDVTSDTSIVLGGAFGYGTSPRSDTPHTIYEFAIRASEGTWWLQLCDPGPSSSCRQTQTVPPLEPAPFSVSLAGTTLSVSFPCSAGLSYTLWLVDLLGRHHAIATGTCSGMPTQTLLVPLEKLATGVYIVRLQHAMGSYTAPVVLVR